LYYLGTVNFNNKYKCNSNKPCQCETLTNGWMILPGANSTPAETLTNGWMIPPGANSTPAETLTNGWMILAGANSTPAEVIVIKT
jgi:hypothetical protein